MSTLAPQLAALARCLPFAFVIACAGDPGSLDPGGTDGSGGKGDSIAPEKLTVARVTGESPLTAGCNATVMGTNFVNTEVQPSLAVNPLDPFHLVAVYQQDRWARFGGNGQLSAVSNDGGASWTAASPPTFTRCTGGTVENGGDFELATDSWVAFSPSGTVFQVAMGINDSVFATAMVVSRSTDGGLTWSAPHTLINDTDERFFDDRPTIAADPYQPGTAYVMWDRIDDASTVNEHAPIYLSKTTDDGVTWSEPRPIYDPGVDQGAIGAQIVFLPDGTLVLGYEHIERMDPDYQANFVVLRSSDGGDTWSSPVTVGDIAGDGTFYSLADPDGGTDNVRSAALPQMAVDASRGAIHAVWRDNRFGAANGQDVAYATSTDGGLTWSPAIQINRSPDGVSAVLPSIAVTEGGVVGVTYFDFRNNDAEATLPTDLWLATCDRDCDHAAAWREIHLDGPFDARPMPLTGIGRMLGDYNGLVAQGEGFVSVAARSTGDAENPTDLYSVATAAP